jgi:hypothetical protein
MYHRSSIRDCFRLQETDSRNFPGSDHAPQTRDANKRQRRRVVLEAVAVCGGPGTTSHVGRTVHQDSFQVD